MLINDTALKVITSLHVHYSTSLDALWLLSIIHHGYKLQAVDPNV